MLCDGLPFSNTSFRGSANPLGLGLNTRSRIARVVDGSDLPPLSYRTAEDVDGKWAEVGFSTDMLLLGSAGEGWKSPDYRFHLRLQHSFNLHTWFDGNFIDCPGNPVSVGGGIYEYWARCTTPHFWNAVQADFTAETTRYAKSLTGISLKGETVSLPNFPYSMPAAAAQLQTDLRANGFPGAVVSTESAALSVGIKNHTEDGVKHLAATLSSGNVTDVSFYGVTIPLSYPYAMPAARATLQADLRSAGHTGAVVRLFEDSWAILLPNVIATGTARAFKLEISPPDPFPFWNAFGEYQGENPDTLITGGYERLRLAIGQSVPEAPKNFFRMIVSTI